MERCLSECTVYYYTLFYALEYGGMLNPHDEADRYALYFVFLDEIQQQLSQFMQGWNHHRMRMCNNQSSLQLWVLGLEDRFANNPNDPAVTGLLPQMVG